MHIKAFKNRRHRPQINQDVSYTPSKDRQGRPCASNVSFIGKGSQKIAFPSGKLVGTAIAGSLFLTSAGLAEWLINRTFLLAPLFLLISFITYLFYATDKKAAQKGRWRTPESHLHLFALIGGWPGAMVAQQGLRHKSKKKEFRFMFWITVILNCGIVIWLLMPQGLPILDSIIREISQLPIIGNSGR
ncbi:DUF1294 domain-containing protein [Pontiellaceae bacterium B1224]|nr:DUF1294 domain-containing protein [Pontiellaceae bacterium B1224]